MLSGSTGILGLDDDRVEAVQEPAMPLGFVDPSAVLGQSGGAGVSQLVWCHMFKTVTLRGPAEFGAHRILGEPFGVMGE